MQSADLNVTFERKYTARLNETLQPHSKLTHFRRHFVIYYCQTIFCNVLNHRDCNDCNVYNVKRRIVLE